MSGLALSDLAPRHRLWRLAGLMASSVLARCIGLAAMPFLLRLYTPADFGAFALFMVPVAILTPLVTGRYEDALPLPRSSATARAMLSGLVMGAGVIAALIGCVLALLAPVIPAVAQLGSLLWLVPPVLFATALFNIAGGWATRQGSFVALSTATVSQSVTAAGVKAGLAVGGAYPMGLALGHLAGVGAAGLVMRRALGQAVQAPLPWARMRIAARRYRDIPTFRVPADLVLNLSMQVLVIAMAMRFSQAIIGETAMAILIVSVPASFLGAALSRSFASDIALAQRTGQPLVPLTASYALKGAIGGALAVVPLVLWGPQLFAVVFGPQWQFGGAIAQVLVMHLLLQCPASAIAPLLTVLQRQRLFLGMQVLRLGATVLALSVAAGLGLDLLGTVTLYTGGLCAFYGLYLCVLLMVARR